MTFIGKKIGHYKVRSAIGAGGMGEVYLAEDTRLDRKVALKILPPEFANDNDRMRRFVREAKSASALNHPNIITIHEIGESEGTHFIATEFIDGKTLNECVKRDRPDLRSVLEIAVQIASALDEAHSAGIVHRDIKPDNVMVRSNGLVKILDFGIAKLSGSNNRPNPDGEAATAIKGTSPGMIIGTANYMSPEQACGKEVDARTDIFSFGVVLYKMVSGSLPFEGETPIEMIGAILHKEPKPLKADVPHEIKRIIGKCLRKDAGERYQTAKELSADLKALQKRLEFEAELTRTSQPRRNGEEAETWIVKAQTTAGNGYQNSIAVLPFANLSNDSENEYFCDGLAEELLNALAKIEDLKVAARTSAFSFKNKNAEVGEIGKTLNVKTILEGSVRRSGNRLRITVQLINAADGYHLWSERYDREMRDIFDVQDEITLAVVGALKVKLLGNEKAAVLKKGTENAEAYELYLKGRFYWNKLTDESCKKAIELFEQAVALDPNYADSYVGISDCYLFLGLPDAMSGTLAPQDSIPKARAAAERALQINPSGAEIYASLAHVKSKEYDWAGAEADYRQSFKLNRNYPLSHLFFGIFLAFLKRTDEAQAEIKTALKLDPLSLPINAGVGLVHYAARRYDETIEQLQKTLEMEPAFPLAQRWLGLALIQKGRFSEAIEAFQKVVDLTDRTPTPLTSLAYGYAVAGCDSEAKSLLEDLLALSQERYVSPYSMATVYIGLNEKEKALEWLEKAFEERNVELLWIKMDPRLDALRGKPRFENILVGMGLETGVVAPPPPPSTDELTKESPTAIISPAATDDSKKSEILIETDKQTSSAKPKGKRKWWLFGMLGLFLLASGFFAYRYFTPGGKQIESIAVLPFENASGNADLEYLSDGVSESVIDRLSQSPQLKVIARSSSFRYRGQNLNLQEIADALGVDAVVTGRIVQRGDSYQIRIEMVDGREDRNLWSETFNRRATDVQILQTDISREIAENLRLKLSGTQTQQTAKKAPDPQAYELVLKGEFYRNKGSVENQSKAIEHFQQAIIIDPNYALAYARLADGYRGLRGDPKELLPKREAAIRRALELDEALPEAHFDMGQYQRDLWNWQEAEKAYRRAMELNPNYSHAYSGLSGLLSLLGRHEEAIAMDKRATELDPVGIIVNTVAGRTLFYARRYDEAIEQLKKTIEFDPNSPTARRVLADVYYSKGMYRESVAEYELTIKLGGAVDGIQARLGAAYVKTGERERALEILKHIQPDAGNLPPNQLAILHAVLGDREQAFAILEKACAERSPGLQFLKVSPGFDDLRSDPRFGDLLRRMNLPH